MDWPKAEKTLIGLFACLNLFLAWGLWGDSAAGAGRWFLRNPEKIRAIEEQFSRSDIRLASPLPPSPGMVQFLRVGRPVFAESEVVRAFFPQPPAAGPLPQRGESSGTRYVDGTGELVVTTRGSIVYTAEPAAGGPATGENPAGLLSAEYEEEARGAAEQFLAGLGWLSPDAKYDGALSGPEPGGITLRYYQETGGRAFFGSRMKLALAPAPMPASAKVGPGGPVSGRFRIVSLERTWMVPQGFGSERRSLIPAYSALLGLAGHLESLGQRGLAVAAVTFGYFSPPYDSDNWEAAPVWRIRAEDGRDYFVNALTGELEQR